MLPGTFNPLTPTSKKAVFSFTLNAATGPANRVGYSNGDYGSVSDAVGGYTLREFFSSDADPDTIQVSFFDDVRSVFDNLKIYADDALIATLGSGSFSLGRTIYISTTSQLFVNGVSYAIEFREP